MAQGKAWNKEEVAELLKPYFLLGYSVNKACDLAQIPHSTVAGWVVDDEELRLKIISWQGQVSARSRQNVVGKIYGQKEDKEKGVPAVEPDTDLSKWWLEKKDKEEFASSGDVSEISINLIASLLQKIYADEKDTDNQDTNK